MKNMQMRRRAAFSFVELLVVMAVIALLAALLLPPLARTKTRAVQLRCVANYRQTGMALQMYCNDSHDRLPPGRHGGVTNYLDLTERPTYNSASVSQLAFFLADYAFGVSPVNVPAVTNTVLKVLACPGYVAAAPGGYRPEEDNFAHAYSFTLARPINPPMDKLRGYPFGRKATGQASLRLAEVGGAGPLWQIWALADVDLDANEFPGNFGPDKQQFIARQPVHRNARNYLFFDLHVGSKTGSSWEEF